MSELKDKQRRFAEEYLVDNNITQAAIRAGYSKKSAHTTGSRLFKDEKVKAFIEEKQAQMSDRCGVTAERVIQELACIAFVNPKDFMTPEGMFKPLNALTDDQSRAISEVTAKGLIKFHDKQKALDMLAKYLKLYSDDDVDQNARPIIIKYERYTDAELKAHRSHSKTDTPAV